MKSRVLVAVVCLPLLFITLFFLPPYIFAGLIALICAICAYELLKTVTPHGNDRSRIYGVFAAVLIPVGAYFDVTLPVFSAVFLLLMCLMFVEAIAHYGQAKKITFAHILVTLFGGAIIPLMLSTLISLRNMPEGRLFVLLPVVSAFVTDGGAYFTGVLMGKHRAFPLISPKKTIEGCIGGLVAGTLAMLIYGVILLATTYHDIVFWALMIYGLIGAVITQLGDLAFSLIKREYEIKDYGRLLPGHGGMLDRFDSMVFASPAIYLLVLAIPAIIVR